MRIATTATEPILKDTSSAAVQGYADWQQNFGWTLFFGR
jgi:hypothetical protein